VSGRRIGAAELDDFLASRMDSLAIPGLSIAVVNGGRVVYHRTLGVEEAGTARRVDGGTVFEAASLTKPVFAYLTLRLVGRGFLELDTPLYRYAPLEALSDGSYRAITADERHRLITARMVLDHTTGLPNWRWNTPDRTLRIQSTPGTRYAYSGEAHELLADVLARLSGTPVEGLEAVFQREVAAPLGMARAALVRDSALARRTASRHVAGEPKGNEWCCEGRGFMASGGLHTEALSYARFLVAVMEGTGLSAAHADEMLREQVRLPADAAAGRDDGVTGWGLGFAIRPSPYGRLHLHGGANTGFRSAFLFQREQKNGYVVFTNSDRGDELNLRLMALFLEPARD